MRIQKADMPCDFLQLRLQFCLQFGVVILHGRQETHVQYPLPVPETVHRLPAADRLGAGDAV